jgi:hypothetical protein
MSGVESDGVLVVVVEATKDGIRQLDQTPPRHSERGKIWIVAAAVAVVVYS